LQEGKNGKENSMKNMATNRKHPIEASKENDDFLTIEDCYEQTINAVREIYKQHGRL
jgi:hypothetical protein